MSQSPMEENEHRSEQKPSSAMVRDATRLRAVMGGSDSSMRAAAPSPPFPEETEVPKEERMETRLRLGLVADTPPSTLGAVTAMPESSATRITPPPSRRLEKEVIGGELHKPVDRPASTPVTHDDTPTSAPRHAPRTVAEPLPARTASSSPRTETYAPPRRRMSGFVALTAIGLGLLIGIAVWAGVGSDLAALFSRPDPEPREANPALVTETPQSLLRPEQSTPLTPSREMASATQPVEAAVVERDPGSSESHAETVTRRREASLSDDTPAEAHRQPRVDEAPQQSEQRRTRQQSTAASSRVSEAPTSTRETRREESDGTRDEPTVRAANASSAVSREEGATSGGGAIARYSVQVRSTTDRREAEGIAERLRDKGVRNVRVETWKKEGVEMFRVRYGRYESSNEAKGEADKLGHSEVWIVRDRSNP